MGGPPFIGALAELQGSYECLRSVARIPRDWESRVLNCFRETSRAGQILNVPKLVF